jgi:hypothetical protein
MNDISDLITYSFLVGGILVMTRPGSQGPALIKNLTSGYSGIVQAATGQTVKDWSAVPFWLLIVVVVLAVFGVLALLRGRV